MNEDEARQALLDLLEDHFPANGFRNLSQYRKCKDAITRLMMRHPRMFHVNLLRTIQASLNESAQLLYEELTARKQQIPTELSDESEPQGPVIDAEPTSNGHVVPYRKTG